MGDLTDSGATPPSNSRPIAVREDCWSEEATGTLIEAWGSRYVELNRGNLRQKDWQEVADAVNSLHGHSKKTYRTDVQCKNRIDTVKKKYKTEKAKISASGGGMTSPWVFYDRLDTLIGPGPGPSGKKPSLSPPISPPMALPLPHKKIPATPALATMALPQKRPAEKADDSYFRRNYSEVAAAAAASVGIDDDDKEEDMEEDPESEDEDGVGMKKLAKAIEKFGEVYQRVEADKLRQMMDLEKQRMQFAKDLEVQRLKMFMDMQVQLEKSKLRRPSSDDTYS